jgi:hypothetical protein
VGVNRSHREPDRWWRWNSSVQSVISTTVLTEY